MANETEGMFLDPSGRLMPLRANTPTDFRVLVTRKLAAGWREAPSSPAVAPLHSEQVLALPPVVAATPATILGSIRAYAPTPIAFDVETDVPDDVRAEAVTVAVDAVATPKKTRK